MSADELHKLTQTRTKTFLNFTSLQAVMRANKTNQVSQPALVSSSKTYLNIIFIIIEIFIRNVTTHLPLNFKNLYL